MQQASASCSTSRAPYAVEVASLLLCAETRCCPRDPRVRVRIPNTQRFQWLSVRERLLRERILMVSECFHAAVTHVPLGFVCLLHLKAGRYIDDNMANAYLAMLLYLQSEDAKKPAVNLVMSLEDCRDTSTKAQVQIYFSSPGAALKPACFSDST